MPKLTDKYRRALMVAEKEGMSQPGKLSQEDLYLACNASGYFWDSEQKLWAHADPADAEPASEVLKLRVWTDKEIVEDLAGDVADALRGLGFKLIEKSRVYQNRPPNQLDGRVYLTFGLPEKKHGKR